ncbi:unnamed protein product [Paramecium octaurelia]|uniref:Transmembrane protein n=1 Tax=Paramecium octaurelia TaxID=43137 RepID=A0A8S1U3R2_PAROT|nr:unnamed protein product [Paramecium octaurelia]
MLRLYKRQLLINQFQHQLRGVRNYQNNYVMEDNVGEDILIQRIRSSQNQQITYHSYWNNEQVRFRSVLFIQFMVMRCVTIVHLLIIQISISKIKILTKNSQQPNPLCIQVHKHLFGYYGRKSQNLNCQIFPQNRIQKQLKDDVQKLQQENSLIYSHYVTLQKNKVALENKVVGLQIKTDGVQALENKNQRNLEKIDRKKEPRNQKTVRRAKSFITNNNNQEIHFWIYFLEEKVRKSRTPSFNSPNNLDQESNFDELQELSINNGVESILLKGNQKLNYVD